MKITIHSLLFFLIGLLLSTCKSRAPDPDPLADGKPRILAVAFAGIPPENIRIDQRSKVISITMPAKLQTPPLPTFTLTENARVQQKEWYTLFLQSETCAECKQIVLTDIQDDQTPVTTYTVKLVASGPLTLDTIDAPFTYTFPNDANESVLIPFLNLYAHPLPKVQYRNRTTQQVIIVDYTSTNMGPALAKGWGGSANKLHIRPEYALDCGPGVFDLEIITSDGRRLTVPQPLIVKKGAFRIENWNPSEGPEVKPGEELRVEGMNLFSGDVSMALIDTADQVISLTNPIFEPCGRLVRVVVPATLSYGHYVLRVERKGSDPMQLCRRLHIKCTV